AAAFRGQLLSLLVLRTAGSQRGFFSRRSHPPIFQAIIFTLHNRIITLILIVLFGFSTQISNYEIDSRTK
ncbi:MAG TPA: hypothetical protein VK144_02325, partial [Bacillota bacterium]|nr:hypothetical protein [Bacillota bacterium]